MNPCILILDDDPNSRATLTRSVDIAGLKSLSPEGPFRNLGALKDFAIEIGATHLVTDHRLTDRPFSNFWGAEAAATLSPLKIAPVLVTNYAPQDMNLNIRPYLEFIPQIIRRSATGPKELMKALQIAELEILEGRVRRSRRKYRTLIEIQEILPLENQVHLLARQWSKDLTIGFPHIELSRRLGCEIRAGMHFIADVNIEAEEADEIFLMNFEAIPEEDQNV